MQGESHVDYRSMVSIRARHCWRAMLTSVRPADFNHEGFNPRPPLLAGDAAGRGVADETAKVSIRARHCWRAMLLWYAQRQHDGHVSIRARHCWRAMREAGIAAQAMARVSIRARHCWRAMLYNMQHKERLRQVSIRARHCWRAMRAPTCRAPNGVTVSIRARHCWRAMPELEPIEVTIQPQFQSAPAIAGGRCASLPTPCQSCTFSCSRANVCSTIPLVKQTYASKEEKHRTTTTYEACEPVRRNAITPGSRRAR